MPRRSAQFARTVLALVAVALAPATACAEAATLVGSNFPVSSLGAHERHPAAAFDPGDDRFLTVWELENSVSEYDLYAQFVSSDGTLDGAAIPLRVSTDDERQPAVAFSPASGTWFVVFEYQSRDVVGMLLDRNGGIAVPAFYVDLAVGGISSSPYVVYDSISDRFIVAWSDTRDGTGDLYGRAFQASDAADVTGEVVLRDVASGGLSAPKLAFNAARNEVFVAYGSLIPDVGEDVFGFAMDAALTAMTTPVLAVSDAPGTQSNPAVTWNAATDEYLIVYQSKRTGPTLEHYDIEAQRIAGDGTLIGGNNVIFSTAEGDTSANADISAISAGGRYLVAFDAPANNFDIQAVELGPTGQPIGPPLAVSSSPNALSTESFPFASWGSVRGEWLLGWQDGRSGQFDIMAQRVKPSGAAGGILSALDSPDPFSPPANGVKDESVLEVRCQVQNPIPGTRLRTTWTIRAPGGASVVRTLQAERPVPDGETVEVTETLTWRGEDDAQNAVVNGEYPYEAAAQLVLPDGSTSNLGTANGAVTVDSTPPLVEFTSPAEGSFLNNRQPPIQGRLTDPSGIDVSSFVLVQDSLEDVTPFTSVNLPDFGFSPAQPMDEGIRSFAAQVRDSAGNAGAAVLTFVVDATAPRFLVLTPPDGATGVVPETEIAATYQDDAVPIDLDSVAILVDSVDRTGEAVVTADAVSFTPATPLTPGQHQVSVNIRDLAGNPATIAWSFTVAGQPEPEPVPALEDVTLEYRRGGDLGLHSVTLEHRRGGDLGLHSVTLEHRRGGDLGLHSVILEFRRAMLAVSQGPANSAGREVSPGEAGVPVLQLSVRGNTPGRTLTLDSLRLAASGTLDDPSGITAVRLYADTNADGALQGGEPLLATTTIGSDNGQALFPGLALDLPAGQSVALLATVDFAAGAASGSTFSLSLAAASDIAALLDGSTPIAGQGSAVAGSDFMVRQDDTTPPVIVFRNPILLQVYSNVDSTVLDFEGQDPESGISGRAADVDGAPVTTGQALDLAALGTGIHRLTVATTNGAGLSTTRAVDFFVQRVRSLAGDRTPAPSIVRAAQPDVVALQLAVERSGATDALTLESIAVRAAGSGDDSTEIASVRLALDLNGDGQFDAGDALLGAAATFAIDDGVVAFGALGLSMPPDQSTRILVLFAMAASAVEGRTFSVRVEPADVVVQGAAGRVAPRGSVAQGTTLTVFENVPPTVSIASPEARIYPESGTVRIDATASDNPGGSGLASLVILLDGAPASNGQVLQLGALSRGTHIVEATATDNAGNSATATRGFIVGSPQAALQQTTDEVVALLADPSLSAAARRNLEEAIDLLAGNRPGANNGAIQRLRDGNIVGAFTRIREAINKLRRAQDRGAATGDLQAELAEFVHQMVQERVHAAVFALGPLDRDVERIQRDFFEGEVRLLAGDFDGAVQSFRQAQQRIQGQDASGADLEVVSPFEGEVIQSGTVPVRVEYTDLMSLAVRSTFRATLDGGDVTSQFTTSGFEATASLATGSGTHTLVVSIEDAAGNVATATRRFFYALRLLVDIEPLRGTSLTVGDLFSVRLRTVDLLGRPALVTGPVDLVFTGVSAPGLPFPDTMQANLIDGQAYLAQVQSFLVAGTQRVTATYVPNPDLFGTALEPVAPGPPCDVSGITGDQQTGNVGEVLPEEASSTVTDAFGNPLGGVEMVWTVASGGAIFTTSGTSSATTIVTESGSGTAPPLQLVDPGHAVIVGSIGGVPVVTFVQAAVFSQPGYDDDGDLVPNDQETALNMNPNDPDSDNDGVMDGRELAEGSNPLLQDSDFDGLSDFAEIFVTHTNPTQFDSELAPFPDLITGTKHLMELLANFVGRAFGFGAHVCTKPGDPVQADTGEYQMQVTDLTIPGRGFDFSFTRTYRAQNTFNGLMGFNWDHNYNIRLRFDPSGNVVVHGGEARFETYVANGGGGFVTPPGLFTRLESMAGGYRLVGPQGWENQFNAGGRLTLIRDRNGNEMSFSYDASGRLEQVNDTLGRPIRFFYTFEGRLREIRDFSGRSIIYGYDPNGDLVTVRSPIVVGTPTGNDFPGGKTVTYTYHSGCLNPELNHNLLTIADAKSQVFVVNAYDAEDRVTKQFYGSGIFTFDYDPILRLTRFKDRRGTITEYEFNAVGNPIRETIETRGLRPGDPASLTTLYEYNADELVTRTTFPRGNSVEYTYDSANPDRLAQANIVDIIQKANGIPGDQAELKVHIDYEPRFQLPKRVTDPRDGGAPGRFTTEFVFDYEVGQGTAGNVVQVIAPTVTEGVASPQAILSRISYNARGQLTSTEDPEGNVTDYFYFPEGDPSGLGNPAARTQAPGGYLAEAIVDARDNGRRSESAPLAMIRNSWTYDLVGNRTSWRDGRGRVTTYLINALNQVVRRVSRAPFSFQTDTFYDANDNVERVVHANDGSVPGEPASYETRYEFDLLDNVEKVLSEVKPGQFLTTRFVRNANEMIEEVRLPEGNVFRTEYDERDLAVSRTRGYGARGASTARFFVDPNGNVTRVLDGTADETSSTLDGFDRVRRVTDGVGGEAALVYDAASNVLEASFLGTLGGISPADRSGSRNALLARVESRFDEVSRPYETRQSYFDPRTGAALEDGVVLTKRLFDRAGRVARVENDNAHGVDLFYDGAHRRVLGRDALGNEVEVAYDANSNPESIVERERPSAGGPVESFTTINVFDELDRLKESIDPGGHTRKVKWDSRGNRVRFEDAEGNVTRWALDGLDRVTQIERDLREGGTGSGALQRTITVKQAWDGNSRLETTTDDRGSATTYQWDELDRLEEVIYADRTTRRRTFTADDRVDTETDQNGTVVKHYYDRLDRLTERIVSKSRTVMGTAFERFEWDGLSRLAKGTDDDSVVEMGYDSLSRVIEEVQNGRSVRTLRDGVGNPVECQYPGGRVIRRAFDDLERTKRIEDGASVLAAYEYKGPWRLFKRTTGNGIEERSDYDSDRRVTSKVHRRMSDNAVVAGFQYAYNAEDQKLFEKVMHPSAQGPTGSGQVYRYDSLYRVREVKYGVADPEGEAASPGSSAFGRKVSYELDGVGNWAGKTESDGQENLISFVAPVANEMNEYLTFGSALERHDDNGNRTEFTREVADGVTSTQLITYDFRNRPIQVWERGASGNDAFVAEYRYDVFNRRIEKQAAGATTRFLWDGWRCIEEQDAAGLTLATYVDGPAYLDEHVSMDRAGRRYYYHQNTLYSTAALTDELGNVVERYSYDIYGTPTFEDAAGVATGRTSSAVGNPFLFTGHRWDPETRFYQARNNSLDPLTGRWIAHDRLGDDALGSLYAYCQGNPVNAVDPLGLDGMPGATVTGSASAHVGTGSSGGLGVGRMGDGGAGGGDSDDPGMLVDLMMGDEETADSLKRETARAYGEFGEKLGDAIAAPVTAMLEEPTPEGEVALAGQSFFLAVVIFLPEIGVPILVFIEYYHLGEGTAAAMEGDVEGAADAAAPAALAGLGAVAAGRAPAPFRSVCKSERTITGPNSTQSPWWQRLFWRKRLNETKPGTPERTLAQEGYEQVRAPGMDAGNPGKERLIIVRRSEDGQTLEIGEWVRGPDDTGFQPAGTSTMPYSDVPVDLGLAPGEAYGHLSWSE